MKKLALSAALVLLAAPAMAHPGHGASGLMAGLAHPVTGADHLLAMLAVGLWSGFVLPRHVWAGAASFMAAMALGAGLSWAGIALPMVEMWITASVAVFGLLTLLARRGQPAGMTGASLAAIALFAMCHGHAHATEATGNALPYLVGFLSATAALHLSGIAIARSIATGGLAQRAIGLGITGAGLWMMAG
ncbi:HupE/UreJ family protein [Fuscibacter oryzae]|uniref:HupE/UreJ family protein n=1 Tax=Fuscibacter oryzae TaxID=2803939 RepID=A0A8J7MSH4_9RHOB|nr:HupE/UreJ family protein [Fuscibacter oryzae]MBL4929278.1 HupE/UreJ family protein [Fuscibacter oryzae]